MSTMAVALMRSVNPKQKINRICISPPFRQARMIITEWSEAWRRVYRMAD